MKYTTQDLLTLVQAHKEYGGDRLSTLDGMEDAIYKLTEILCADMDEVLKEQQASTVKALCSMPLSREEAIERLRQMSKNVFSSEWTFAMDNVRGWAWLELNNERRALFRDGMTPICFEDVFPEG